jgi:LPS sulfotransferase NodH
LERVKFVIICAARTGSTFLVHLLRSNPQVISHGEVFTDSGIGFLMGKYAQQRRRGELSEEELYQLRTDSLPGFFDKYVYDFQGKKAAGFKFKTDEMFLELYADVTNYLQENSNIQVLFLRRKNLLDQYISHQVVLNQTAVTLITDDKDRPVVQPFEVDINDCKKYIACVKQREKDALRLLSGHDVYFVNYEELVDSQHVHGEMQRFLKLDVQPLSSKTKKIIKRQEDIVLNYTEVFSQLRDEGLIVM